MSEAACNQAAAFIAFADDFNAALQGVKSTQPSVSSDFQWLVQQLQSSGINPSDDLNELYKVSIPTCAPAEYFPAFITPIMSCSGVEHDANSFHFRFHPAQS